MKKKGRKVIRSSCSENLVLRKLKQSNRPDRVTDTEKERKKERERERERELKLKTKKKLRKNVKGQREKKSCEIPVEPALE